MTTYSDAASPGDPDGLRMTRGATSPTVRAPHYRINRRDVISTWSVVGLTLLALVLGYLFRELVESRTREYQLESGVTVSYPEGWTLDASRAEAGTVRAINTRAGAAPTVMEMQSVTVDPAAKDQEVLGLVSNNLIASRSTDLTGFKVLDKESGQIDGKPGMTTQYVYVFTPNSGPFRDYIPVVMRGEGQLVRKGPKAYAFSIEAAEDNWGDAQDMLDDFVTSAELP